MRFGTVATAALLIGGCTGKVGGTFFSSGGSAPDSAGTGGSDAVGGVPGVGGASSPQAGGEQATSGSSGTGGEAGQASDATGGTSAGGVGGTDITGSGLWCDVQRMLADRCWSCHSNPPAKDVPMALVTAQDLVAASATDPTATNALMSLGRMQNSLRPMPPKPANPAAADEVQLMKDWIDGGMPTTCDSGTGGAGPVVDPYDTPVTCSSNTRWTRGDAESPLMHPGGACIDCHSSGEGEGPVFALAGTVFPTAHEPSDCNGVDGTLEDVKVVILDANDKTYTLDVNAAGNFFYESRGAAVALPYRAKVVRGALERLMPSAQMDGDCNICHTESGAQDAPGRIMAP